MRRDGKKSEIKKQTATYLKMLTILVYRKPRGSRMITATMKFFFINSLSLRYKYFNNIMHNPTATDCMVHK